ncbi:MAG: hypothetical protein ACFBSG_20275 [Leptolyngbyaceae cyanobacterium]
MVIIPNGVLGQETIYNYTLLYPIHGDRITFTFSNEEAPNRVIPVLRAAVLSVEGIEADPEPEVRPLQFGDHQAEYEVQYCIADFTKADTIQGKFITNVYYAAKRHQLKLPVPAEKRIVLPHDPATAQDTCPISRMPSPPCPSFECWMKQCSTPWPSRPRSNITARMKPLWKWGTLMKASAFC